METVYKPSIPGPHHRCLRCFSELNDEFAFCPTCGRTGTVFIPPASLPRKYCAYHPDKRSVAYCCECDKAICDECKDAQRTHLSFSIGTELNYCIHCTSHKQRLEENFACRLSACGACAKHNSILSRFNCKECNLPLCGDCSYFSIKGMFRASIRSGPFCLICFRTKLPSDHRSRWISGADAVKRKLVRYSIRPQDGEA